MNDMRCRRWCSALLTLVMVPALGLMVARGTAGASPQQAGQAAAVKNARLPEPPASAAGATYVGNKQCAECHKEVVAGFNATLHAKSVDKRTPAAVESCETCHGPASKHIEDPDNPLRSFKKVDADESAAVCTTCHMTSEHALWSGSKHEDRKVACATCHSVHASKGPSLLKEESMAKQCASCHRQIVNKLNRFNHMPVREGQLTCTSCHNTHGSSNVKMLRTGTTVDEACTSCHAEKRGPFLWAHAPVVNACVTCHDPHGSSNERMLVAKVPFLCQRCHVTSRHPPTVYNQANMADLDPTLSKTASTSANRLQGRGCVGCHAQIHGSNAPSGKYFHR